MHFRKSGLLLLAFVAGIQIAGKAQAKKFLVTAGLQAQVTHTQGNTTVDVALPGVDLISLDLTQPGDGVFQIKTTDYNGDGYKDFAFVGGNSASGMQVYDIFLYHPDEKTFDVLEVPDGACEVFGNVRLNAGDKTLRSSCKTGAKSSLDIFKWADPFTLELVNSVDNSADAQEEKAEGKADLKTEKAEQRKDKREQRKDAKAEKEED